ncbi:MAG: N-acetylmuramoyl-L-alanine amidase [Deltaproteobacteria bacterium]|nr:N-acetylmuramoyl-L-alanine amidase [Deltaproteobacteria bacterium]MCL4872656.1 N-acetylmuramoyl-L-alanine amidase [bacterium]
MKSPAARPALFFLLALALLLISAGKSPAAPKAAVTDIRHWSNPTYTRVVINVSGKASFTHRLLRKDPSISVEWRRLYVDISGAMLSPELARSIPINDGLLKAARAGQYDTDTVRVVLDIESIQDFKIFYLTDPYRIVIDVTGDKPAGRDEVIRQARDRTGKAAPEIRQDPRGLPLSDPSLTQQLGLKVRKIVIDPGHGGKDPGAVGRTGLKEKDINLKLGLMLREKLEREAGATVVMTRDRDVFVPLEERTAIANREEADLFISIHTNAAPRRTASGIETYILGISNDEEAKRVAARENATSTRSVSDLEFILNDLIKTAKTNDSARFAGVVQDSLVSKLRASYRNVRSNGVKGAPFYVLIGTKMPAVLVEVSFISNPLEEERLKDPKYLKEAVDGIADGVLSYMNGPGET